jgi:hypothetical protein
VSGYTFKILNGTQRGQDDLCPTCESACIWHDEKGEQRRCSAMHHTFQPAGRVTVCSNYSDIRIPSLQAMKSVAWTLRTEKGGKQIGFTPPVKRDRPSYGEDD